MIPGNIFPEKTFQMNIGIKHVIIITNDPIYPDREIETHFKRAHLPFFCMSTDHFSGIYLFCGPELINRIIYPVKMSFCIRTFLRCTFRSILKTQFFLCRDRRYLEFQTFFPQDMECLLRHSSCDGFCSKIKKCFTFSLTDSAHRRKNGRHGFSHTGRCLDK